MTSPHGHGADGETYRPGSPLVLVWDTGSRAYPPAAAGLGTSMQSRAIDFSFRDFCERAKLSCWARAPGLTTVAAAARVAASACCQALVMMGMPSKRSRMHLKKEQFRKISQRGMARVGERSTSRQGCWPCHRSPPPRGNFIIPSRLLRVFCRPNAASRPVAKELLRQLCRLLCLWSVCARWSRAARRCSARVGVPHKNDTRRADSACRPRPRARRRCQAMD